MNVTMLIDALRQQQAFRSVQRYVRENGYGHMVGWEDLIDLIQNGGNSKVLIAALQEMHEGFSINGRKHVYLYEPSEASRKALLNCKPTIAPEGWPWPPKGDERIDVPILVHVRDSTKGRYFVFGSHRINNVEEDLDKDYLDEKTPAYVRQAKITYRAAKWTWMHDVLMVPKSGELEIRIGETLGTSYPRTADVRTSIVDRISVLIPPNIALSAFHQPIDVGGAVRALYNARNADKTYDGRVYWLDFGCESKAKRRERFSRHTPEDLRKEAYHVAGTKAVKGLIDIYGLGVAWINDGERDLCLEFHGSPSKMQDSELQLYEALISTVATGDEFQFLVGKLKQYVDASRG